MRFLLCHCEVLWGEGSVQFGSREVRIPHIGHPGLDPGSISRLGSWPTGGCRIKSGMRVGGVGGCGIRPEAAAYVFPAKYYFAGALRRATLGLAVGRRRIRGARFLWLGCKQCDRRGSAPSSAAGKAALGLGLGTSPGRCPQALPLHSVQPGGCGTDRVAIKPLEVIPPASPA